jgi:hypothetical protein
MDVFTGLITGLYAAHLAGYLTERCARATPIDSDHKVKV